MIEFVFLLNERIFEICSNFFYIFFLLVWMWLCHSACFKVRRQLVGVGFLFPLYGSQELNSSC